MAVVSAVRTCLKIRNSGFRTSLFLDRQDGVGPRFAGDISSPNVRLLVQTEGIFRPVCKLLLPRNDLSFAIVPYSARKEHSYRLTALGRNEPEKKIHCADAKDFASIPKMQFHQSGRVHLSGGEVREGNVAIPPLAGVYCQARREEG